MGRLTTALVLETNNLLGGAADADAVCAGLERLLRRLQQQTHPLAALDEIVITHDGLGPAHHRRLEAAVGRALTLHSVPAAHGYYAAKNAGFLATTGDVVVFADADCWPEAGWLDGLLAPFDDPSIEVVAGRTTYRGNLLGIAATTIDFMYFPSPLGDRCVRNFYANNVAFRRAVFEKHCYAPFDAVYRGHCQVLGLRLQAAGVRVYFAPAARTTHRFPDGWRELVTLRLRRGEDSVELTPHLAHAYLPRRLHALGRLRALSLLVLAMRFGYSVRSLGKQDMPPVSVVRAPAAIAAIALLSAVDAAGAVHRTLRPRAGQADASALSYHGDRDRLSA